MGGPNVVPAGPQYSKQDLQGAYSTLLNNLNEAYWAASDLNAKDQVYGCIEAVTEVLAQMDAADLENRDAAYLAVLQQVSTVNKGLNDSSKSIR